MRLWNLIFYAGVILFMVGSSVVYLEFAPVKLLKGDFQAFFRGLLGAAIAVAGWFTVRTAINRSPDRQDKDGAAETRKL